MLTIYPKTDPIECAWSKYLEQYDWDKNIDESDDELDAEAAQMSPEDTNLYQSCPVWEELIFVKCRYCNSSILPNSIKNHVEMRHTGDVKYEKDPEFSIFRKKSPLPTAVSLTANSQASSFSTTPLGIFEGPYSRTSPFSGDAFNQSPRIAEQFLGWPNSPHGAIQQSPLNMTNNVRVKPESKPKVVIPGNNCKSALAKSTTTQRRTVPEILPALLSPVEKDEPYNQTFSFSAANAMSNSSLFNKPSTTLFNMPSTSSFELPSTSFELPSTLFELPSTSFELPSTSFELPSTSSFNMPSTSSFDLHSTSAFNLTSTSSYDMPATSSQDFLSTCEKPSTSRGLLPCEPLSAHRASFEQSFPAFHLPPTIATVASEPQEKEPVIEKLVLRRVLQTDPKESAERSQSVQGLKGVAKNKKDSSQHYFMVVKRKDRQQDLGRQQIQKQTNVVFQEKDKIKEREKKKKTKTITKLIQELKRVKLKLDLCNRSKEEIEQKLFIVKINLEKTKRITIYQNEILLKQKEKFDKEIDTLKQTNVELTNSLALESAQIYRGLGNHPWNFADNHMSKQFQTIEEQKLELQRRIEELECEYRELKNSSTIERVHFEAKLRQYFKVMRDLKRRLDEQTTRSEELKLQKDFYEKNLPPEICYQVKSQLASFQQQSEVCEIFPGLLTPQPTPPIASPAVPLAETLLSEMQNINYITFQSQMSPDSTGVFQQPQQPQPLEVNEEEEEVS